MKLPTSIQDRRKVAENTIGYVVLFLIMFGQGMTAVDVLFAQFIYLAANITSLYRTFTLGRPAADKIKDVACFALTSVIIIIRFV